MDMTDPHQVHDLTRLEALFGPVGEAARRKEVRTLHPLYRQMIEASPFAVLATSGPDGLDASPRGDPRSVVKVQDECTLLLPERRGNNRIDSLRNIVADPRVALLFLIPGAGETLRVNGRARISVAPELLASLTVEGRLPTCVVVIRIEAVYFQCARAIKRSGLWSAAARGAPQVPTPGAILQALTGSIDGAAYDNDLPARQAGSLY